MVRKNNENYMELDLASTTVDVVMYCTGVSRFSFSDRLLHGPDVTTMILELLHNFPLRWVAISVYIGKMFVQGKLAHRCINSFRLFRWTGLNCNKEYDDID